MRGRPTDFKNESQHNIRDDDHTIFNTFSSSARDIQQITNCVSSLVPAQRALLQNAISMAKISEASFDHADEERQESYNKQPKGERALIQRQGVLAERIKTSKQTSCLTCAPDAEWQDMPRRLSRANRTPIMLLDTPGDVRIAQSRLMPLMKSFEDLEKVSNLNDAVVDMTAAKKPPTALFSLLGVPEIQHKGLSSQVLQAFDDAKVPADQSADMDARFRTGSPFLDIEHHMHVSRIQTAVPCENTFRDSNTTEPFLKPQEKTPALSQPQHHEVRAGLSKVKNLADNPEEFLHQRKGAMESVQHYIQPQEAESDVHIPEQTTVAAVLDADDY
jgi:hypothetical protein